MVNGLYKLVSLNPVCNKSVIQSTSFGGFLSNFSAISWQEQFTFRRDDDDILCTKTPRLVGFLLC